MEQNVIKQCEMFPRIPLPHTYIMVIYFEFMNFDPFVCLRQDQSSSSHMFLVFGIPPLHFQDFY